MKPLAFRSKPSNKNVNFTPIPIIVAPVLMLKQVDS
jgi:hypothetical protein